LLFDVVVAVNNLSDFFKHVVYPFTKVLLAKMDYNGWATAVKPRQNTQHTLKSH
jgi:hypothetical protein